MPATLLHEESAPEEVWESLRRAQRGLRVRALPEVPPPPSSTRVPSGMTHVYVREDAAKSPLQSLYRGPYRVLKQLRNSLVLQMGDSQDSVSLA